jgi:hypothetical protein
MRLHTQAKSPYHYCGRCGTVQPLAKLKWERGVLVCSTYRCEDTMQIGDREAIIVKKLSNVGQEGQPDRKLTAPSEVSADEDIIF